MPPIHLLQCNSWQPQPKISVSFRGPSPGNIRKDSTSISMKGWATPVATESVSSPTVTNEPHSIASSLKPANMASNIQGPVEFKTVVMDLKLRLIARLSYNPHLQELAVTLPSPIHEVVLVPLPTALGIIIDSLTILNKFDISLPIHMALMVDAPATLDLPADESYWLGIPDLVVMFQTHDTDILPYWLFEVSVSETSKSAVVRLQTYGDQNENVLAATHISIIESQTHVSPMDEWGIEKIRDLTSSEDGRVMSLSHTWFHPTTVTITTWICPPNKRLNLKSHHASYYATVVLYPNQYNQGLQKVKHIFKHTLENIRDMVVRHLQTEHVHDQALPASLQAVKSWSPPK
ncbi:hypothetical protein BDR04DRAFT_1120532 [Suillus decipiens]|nr:hypothetical protein BDR04DRAFT_1120532 [Suillus decipiens]